MVLSTRSKPYLVLSRCSSRSYWTIKSYNDTGHQILCVSSITSRECVPHGPRAPVPFPPSRPLEHPSQEPTTTHSTPSRPGGMILAHQTKRPTRAVSSYHRRRAGLPSPSGPRDGRRVTLGSGNPGEPSQPGLAASPAETEDGWIPVMGSQVGQGYLYSGAGDQRRLVQHAQGRRGQR